MSSRNNTVVRGAGQDGFFGELKDGFAALREALQTKTARRVIFVVKFLLSLLTIFYFYGIVRAAYRSLFYRLDILETQVPAVRAIAIAQCLLYGILMLVTRRQFVTRMVILLSMPFYFPIFLFNYQHLCFIIPLGVMIVITYLASGLKEGTKTILGAVFLAIYAVGAFIFMAVQSILSPATTETVTERAISPNGKYRYSVVQVEDQADGRTYVSIEPNSYDIKQNHSIWYAKGYTKQVYQERPLCVFQIEWKTESRANITRELLANNPSITFTFDKEQMQNTGLSKDYTHNFTLDELSQSQRVSLGYLLEEDLENGLYNGKSPEAQGLTQQSNDFEVSLTFDQIKNMAIDMNYDVRLSTMTDEQLASLGVPEDNEVLLVNGKTVFREYVAVLEHTFDESARDMGAFMESNQVPEVHPEGVPIPETTVPQTTTTTRLTTTTFTSPIKETTSSGVR